MPILLIVSFRPDFKAPWTGRAGTSLIALARLGRRDSETLAERVTTDRALSREVLKRIVTQADGVPLFIEELTKAVLEASVDPGAAAGPLAVPATLQASLMARLATLDKVAAEQLPGVYAVLTGEDWTADGLGTLDPEFMAEDMGGPKGFRSKLPPLAEDRVRYVGERVAVVIATTEALARDAAELVSVAYEVLPVVVSAGMQCAPARRWSMRARPRTPRSRCISGMSIWSSPPLPERIMSPGCRSTTTASRR